MYTNKDLQKQQQQQQYLVPAEQYKRLKLLDTKPLTVKIHEYSQVVNRLDVGVYKNDPHLIKIFLNFVVLKAAEKQQQNEFHPDINQLYEKMLQYQIGLQSPLLYRQWSDYLMQHRQWLLCIKVLEHARQNLSSADFAQSGEFDKKLTVCRQWLVQQNQRPRSMNVSGEPVRLSGGPGGIASVMRAGQVQAGVGIVKPISPEDSNEKQYKQLADLESTNVGGSSNFDSDDNDGKSEDNQQYSDDSDDETVTTSNGNRDNVNDTVLHVVEHAFQQHMNLNNEAKSTVQSDVNKKLLVNQQQRPVAALVDRQENERPALREIQPQQILPQPPQTPSVEQQRQLGLFGVNQKPRQCLVVNGKQYQRLDMLGKGGSSKVFQVMGVDGGIFALKRVQLRGVEQATIEGYLNEIKLLNSLTHCERIIRLYDSEINTEGGFLHMLMECGEIDLAHVLHKQTQTGERLSMNFVRVYWQQMLEAVDAIHEARIVHADVCLLQLQVYVISKRQLKPANFLFVKGALKLIDFGIAKAIESDTTNIHRDNSMGTVNYMSPEAIQDSNGGGGSGKRHLIKLGRPSDVWSLGCILYQMVNGKTPFHELAMIPKLHRIVDSSQPIYFPPVQNPHLLQVMQRCLRRNPQERFTIPQMLNHPFLRPDEVIAQMNKQPQLNPTTLQKIMRMVIDCTEQGKNQREIHQALVQKFIG